MTKRLLLILAYLTFGLFETQAQDNDGKYPCFPGGQNRFLRYLCDNIQYPDESLNLELTGRVIASFSVGKNGIVRDIKCEQSRDEYMEEMVLKALKNMPQWQKGQTPIIYQQIVVDFNLLPDSCKEDAIGSYIAPEQDNYSQHIIVVGKPVNSVKIGLSSAGVTQVRNAKAAFWKAHIPDKPIIIEQKDTAIIQLADFSKGGEAGFLEYLLERVRCPQQIIDNGGPYVIIADFHINNIETKSPKITVSDSRGEQFEGIQEIQELFNNMPKWKPATIKQNIAGRENVSMLASHRKITIIFDLDGKSYLSYDYEHDDEFSYMFPTFSHVETNDKNEIEDPRHLILYIPKGYTK